MAANGWTDDPELVAIFRAEVDEKLASLNDGLLRLEEHPAPKQLITSLFRDAHTVKGSARALALDGVVGLAHRAEDLLGALKDGRFAIRRDLVDLLLAVTDAISHAMPGVAVPISDLDVQALIEALDRALSGEDPVEVPKPTPAPTTDTDEDEPGRARTGDSVRVATRRVHALLDVVGEAELENRRVERQVIAVSRLVAEHVGWAKTMRSAAVGGGGLPAEVSDAMAGLVALSDQLTSATRELRGRVEDSQNKLSLVRDGAMGLAMVPVRRVVAAFPQLVREVAAVTGKDVVLVLEGEDVELDTRVLDGVADALKHLVTNAVDHGCQTQEQRRAAGRTGRATVRLSARAAGSAVVISVQDDGPGIDQDALRAAAVRRGLVQEDSTISGQQLLSLLFVPGFTTRETVTETSGRGVGLDVVTRAAEALGGAVDVESEAGEGTTFTLTLPVTLGVMRCLVARLGGERYAVPVTNVVETLNLRDALTQAVAGAPMLLRHGQTIPVADLGSALGVAGDRDQRVAIVVRYGGGGEQLAWAVDALEGELELVVKDLGSFLGRPPGVNGATIDGDGSVLLLLDVRELALKQLASGQPFQMPTAGPRGYAVDGVPAASVNRRPRVLIVEDSIGVRELQRVILEGAGYDVVTAVDGLDGAGRLGGDPFDLVLSDVEMPGMDGFTLTRTIRKTRGWEEVPVVIMTSRGDDADKRAGLDAGASAYLLKSDFDQAELVDTVRRLVGR